MNEIYSQLGENFQKYFEIVYACTEEQKKEAFRIRHQVYCEELKYEPLQEDKCETDEYDPNSFHLLLRSKKSNEYVGCTRIICPRLNIPGYRLPFEKICANTINSSIIDIDKIPRNMMAEVSRLTIVTSYRKRKSDTQGEFSITNADFDIGKGQRFPYIPISLFMGTIRLAQIKGIDYLFLLTDEKLAHHFSKLGSDIQPIGKPVEHRGKRVPSVVCISKTINKMKPSFRSFYQIVVREIDSCNPAQSPKPTTFIGQRTNETSEFMNLL